MDQQPDKKKQNIVLLVLILFQLISTVIIARDTIRDLGILGIAGFTDSHLLPEILATVGLIIGIGIGLIYLTHLLRRQARFERGIGVAAGALNDLMEGYYAAWKLTVAEQDVATFTFKGYSISEIAGFRGSREGTIKAHLNAIYRKAGVSGRAALVSLLIEDLMSQPLIQPKFAGTAAG